MKRLCSLLFLSGAYALAAPPVIPPGGLTPEQIIAHRQGVDINARQTAAQNVVGSRSDEYSAMNPGSGQARFLFNTMVVNSSISSTTQTSPIPGNRLSAAFKGFVSGSNQASSLIGESPIASKIESSKVQGMVFLGQTPAPLGQSSVGAVAVTPQMMNKAEKVTQKIMQQQQNVEQKYVEKVNEVKSSLEANGYEVTTAVSRGDNPKVHVGDYYVIGPNGGYVEVSTSTIDATVGNTALKNVAVYKPDQSTGMGVSIAIPHPDAKAAIILESNITPSTETAKAALEVSSKNGNITFVTVPPPLP